MKSKHQSGISVQQLRDGRWAASVALTGTVTRYFGTSDDEALDRARILTSGPRRYADRETKPE